MFYRISSNCKCIKNPFAKQVIRYFILKLPELKMTKPQTLPLLLQKLGYISFLAGCRNVASIIIDSLREIEDSTESMEYVVLVTSGGL